MRTLTRRAVSLPGPPAISSVPFRAASHQLAPPAANPTEALKPAAQHSVPAAPGPLGAWTTAAKEPTISKARTSRELTVVQVVDFHRHHNRLVESEIKECGAGGA